MIGLSDLPYHAPMPSNGIHTIPGEDVTMRSLDDALVDAAIPNGLLNGDSFIDPRVLNSLEDADADITDSIMDDASSAESQISKDPLSSLTASPRKKILPTGCCYDDRMTLHANADFSASPHHPEDPRRIKAIFKEFRDAGLIFRGSDSDLADILRDNPTKYMWRIAAREAQKAEICLMHTNQHFEWVAALQKKTSEELRQMTDELDIGRKSLYVGNLSFTACLVAAGGAIETCKHVVEGNVKNAIAVIRPPGHHAEYNESMGFCLFNNVPIAAKVCMEDYPETCKKILILDWDVHHGNGVQNMFYEEPNVLYISLHVYQNGVFYPGRPDDDSLPDGGLDKCGAGAGAGRNVNIGWHDQGMGDGEYMAAFQRIVMPIAQEFDPDLVIVSAGFDAAVGDELGGCFVTPACYSHMTHMLMSLANGKVAVCLEGGYNLKAISQSALAVAKTLMGEPPGRMHIPDLNHEAAKVLDQVQQCQAPYWRCMRAGIITLPDTIEKGAVRGSEMIRSAQKVDLAKRFDMVSLYVQRQKINSAYNDQVLATPSLHLAKKILVIIHDPPPMLAVRDPVTNIVEPHNSFIQDSIPAYISLARSLGFGIIDINIPLHISSNLHPSPSTIATVPRVSETELGDQMQELMCYLWDNYLELSPSSHIVLMGVGNSYLGVKQLLVTRDQVRHRVKGVVCFVTGHLRPVKSASDEGLAVWYKRCSRIYVSPAHACWNDEEARRKVARKRFGNVIRSEVEGLGEMLDKYRQEVGEWFGKWTDGADEAKGKGKGKEETGEMEVEK